MFRVFASCLSAFLLIGCETEQAYLSQPVYQDKPSETRTATYRFAIHPLFNPSDLQTAYQPLIDHLSREIDDAQFTLEGSIHYQSYEEKIRAQAPDFLLPNPWQTLIAMDLGYRVIAEAGESEDFKGIFLARKGAPIEQPSDLRGRVVSYPSPTALAAAIMPQMYLHDQGVNVTQDIENIYVGSQRASILNVYLGTSELAATWPPAWRMFQKSEPEKAKDLRLIWETDSLINNSVMAHARIPQTLVDQVQAELVKLAQSESGRLILQQAETAYFRAARDSEYDQVRAFISRFESEVRAVEEFKKG